MFKNQTGFRLIHASWIPGTSLDDSQNSSELTYLQKQCTSLQKQLQSQGSDGFCINESYADVLKMQQQNINLKEQIQSQKTKKAKYKKAIGKLANELVIEKEKYKLLNDQLEDMQLINEQFMQQIANQQLNIDKLIKQNEKLLQKEKQTLQIELMQVQGSNQEEDIQKLVLQMRNLLSQNQQLIEKNEKKNRELEMLRKENQESMIIIQNYENNADTENQSDHLVWNFLEKVSSLIEFLQTTEETNSDFSTINIPSKLNRNEVSY